MLTGESTLATGIITGFRCLILMAHATTIAGSWGFNASQLKGAPGVDVNSTGDVYVADWENHRIQKFALGVPKWKQVNINGFGKHSTNGVNSLRNLQWPTYASALNPGFRRSTLAAR